MALIEAIFSSMRSLKGSAKARDEQMERKLASVSEFPAGVAMPLNPSVRVLGVVPRSVKTFTSSSYPALVKFRVAENVGTYTCMFKSGDDMRQDQLTIQLLKIIDAILRDDGIDLAFTIYDVLPISASEGIITFVDGALPLRIIETRYGSINGFFCGRSANSRSDVDDQVRDCFVESCAVWCVATYILAIGDRHLDNILVKRTGQVIHIDFGFIFGRDPKPFGTPPVRLTPSMVTAMGGKGSPGYTRFEQLARAAFISLRRHSTLILNLVRLMVDAGIPLT